MSLLYFADEDWHLLFGREGLSYLVARETAQPEKEEAAQTEVLKPQVQARFKADLTSAFTSYQRKPSVTGLLAQAWKYKPMRGLYTHVLWTVLIKPRLCVYIHLLQTPHWVRFWFFSSLSILLSSQKSRNIIYLQPECFYNAFNLRFRLYVGKVNVEN